MTEDTGKYPYEWSDRKIMNEIDVCLNMAVAAPTPNLALGYYGGARALLSVMCERLQKITAPNLRD